MKTAASVLLKLCIIVKADLEPYTQYKHVEKEYEQQQTYISKPRIEDKIKLVHVRYMFAVVCVNSSHVCVFNIRQRFSRRIFCPLSVIQLRLVYILLDIVP